MMFLYDMIDSDDCIFETVAYMGWLAFILR